MPFVWRAHGVESWASGQGARQKDAGDEDQLPVVDITYGRVTICPSGGGGGDARDDSRNAIELAQRLLGHPRVTRVHHPGLPDHPGHGISAAQSSGPGAVLSFEVTGTGEEAEAVCNRTRLIVHATSLGGVETLIERRARYASEVAAGTPATLLRLSVGIEDVEDIWRDLEQALDR